jgi:ERCC4-related helicase
VTADCSLLTAHCSLLTVHSCLAHWLFTHDRPLPITTPVIESIDRTNPYFRVLGLSATPGKDLEKVQEVIHKLKITHMEVRTDDDDDVKPYIKTRMEEVVEVKNSRSNGGPVENLRKRFF